MTPQKKTFFYESRWIGWIGGACLLTWIGIALFPIYALFLPTFGSIEIQSPTKTQRWKGYKITCRERLGTPTISFTDPETGSERKLTLLPGETLNSRPQINTIWAAQLDETSDLLNKESCRTFKGFITNERAGMRTGGRFEYRISFDCDQANARLLVDLHSYNCLSDSFSPS